MTSTLVQDPRKISVMNRQQMEENFQRLSLADQQSAALNSLYFHQMSALQFVSPQYQQLTQQSFMSSWPFQPSFFPTTWPSLAQLSSPNSELVNNNYLSQTFSSQVSEESQVKISSLSPMSQSPSPRSQKNDSIEIVKSDKKKKFGCNICGKTFGYKHVLQNHEKVHSGEKPYRCEKCNKCFRRDHHLKVHLRLHSGEKPFSCPFPMCDRQFVQVANLRRHVKTHENGVLKIHEKMLKNDSESSGMSSQDHEDYATTTSSRKRLDFRYESPEQSEPEDLSIKKNLRLKVQGKYF